MERNQDLKDIENGPRKLEENEESWFKKTKIKFKAGENSQIDSEEDEKKRKDGKEKEMESNQGKNRKMIKKANNNNKKGSYEAESERNDSEEENRRWKDSKGLAKNPKKLGENKDNNDARGHERLEKKKFVAGKLRIVDGVDGPTPKMIEVESEIKGIKRASKVTRAKKRLAITKCKGKQITSTQMEGEEMGLASQDGADGIYGIAGSLATQLEGNGDEEDRQEKPRKGGIEGDENIMENHGEVEKAEGDNNGYDNTIGDDDKAESMEGDEEGQGQLGQE